ncbi:delta-60 repeat domain-containing protein [Sphingobacterium sp. E70]|uniref:delta-60 repeat domain-containing protein n=1 Tax=Sphingobacterium sp. E70 TaxID=2853439 RepID=UPI00211B7BC5|nr:delta-60 repeat domain-containing protein [Sphingobacterium sp. E70]ULT26028.1 delta-60 repeat domain-containing protein [Sphingobacterium sp. E70]
MVDNSSFPKRGSYGVNGGVFDATMDDKGTLTMVGSFTQYNNKISASRILRLKTSGELDTEFNAGVGADNTIYKIVPVGNKFYLIGSFLNYKGQQTNNIVLINADGSVDPSFKAKSFTGDSRLLSGIG